MSNFVTFSPVVKGPGLGTVKVLLGENAPVASADGGWAVINRPKNKGFTAWEGHTPYQMTVSVLFDGVTSNRQQQSGYDALVRLMRTKVGGAKQPTPVRLFGNVPGTAFPWVIQGIEQDSSSIIRRSSDGRILRIAAEVSLLEYVEADVLVSVKPSPAKRVSNSTTPSTLSSAKTYTVKKGDSLSKIAQEKLGSWAKFKDIASLNGIRDPNRIQVGQVLKLP